VPPLALGSQQFLCLHVDGWKGVRPLQLKLCLLEPTKLCDQRCHHGGLALSVSFLSFSPFYIFQDHTASGNHVAITAAGMGVGAATVAQSG